MESNRKNEHFRRLIMKTAIKIGNKVYQVEISETGENLLKVKVNEKEYFFTKNELSELSLTETSQPFSKETEIISPGLAEKEIKSPIAGTISAVYVKKGEQIKPGQKVVTLISMKMENEVVSEGYGKVKEVKAKENQFVNNGDTLIILE